MNRAIMCDWYMNNGRCGEGFPTHPNQFMFIEDDVVTNDDQKQRKKECEAKPPSPKESSDEDDISDEWAELWADYEYEL